MMMTMILLSFVVLFATCITLQAFQQRKRLLEEKKRREEQEREHKRRRIEELSKSSRRGRSSAAEMSGDGGGDGGGTVDGSGSNDSGNSNRNSSTHSGNDENASVPDHSIPQSAATSPCIASSTQSENQSTADNTTASGSIIPAKPIIPFSLRYKFPTKFRQAALDKLIEAQISCGVDRQYAIDCALQKEMDLYNQFSSRNVYWSSAMRLAQRIARSEETLSLHQEDQVSDVVEAQSEQQESESSLDLAATLAETNSGEINIAEPSSKT